MAEQNVEEWLEAWIEENIQTPVYYDNKAHMKADAAQCREQAKAEGISEPDLVEAAGGDLEAYLLREQAWFKKCHFQVTPEIDRALMVKGFLVLGVTLI